MAPQFEDEVVADFIRRLDAGELEGRFVDELRKLTAEQVERVSQILWERKK